jgi:hypothetical protein
MAYAAHLRLNIVPLTDSWARRQLFICTRAGEEPPGAMRRLLDHLLGGGV